MKLSVSLPEDDVAVLDEHIRRTGLSSRSAALHHAIGLLRHTDLEQDYAQAWTEWETTGDATAWDTTASDGMS